MKSKTIISLLLLPATILCLAIASFGQVIIPKTQIQKPALPVDEIVNKMSADETTLAEATGIPRPDLAVTKMCIERDKENSAFDSVKVLLANVGSVDAGEFAMGFIYTSSVSDRFVADKISGLKAGEEKWLDYFHICCGLAPSVFLVNASNSFTAIADAKYYQKSPIPGDAFGNVEIKAKILESNEKNNQLTVSKSEIKDCSEMKIIDKPVSPNLQKIKPVIKKP